MKKICILLLVILGIVPAIKAVPPNPPIYIAFLWHMHQPIYYPNESAVVTYQNNRYPFNLWSIFQSRTGPYTYYAKDAVQMGISANMPHFGAQVSFSGSLIENLNNWEQANFGFSGWKTHWNTAKTQTTSLGNPRLDMVGFGYHHPLMPLIDYADIRTQIQKHKAIMGSNFSGNYSKGIFPPENAFGLNVIPALVDEGLKWVLVDNIHFDRACANYPYNTSGNLYEANKADVQNPNPNDWVQLSNLWAPTQNSARWGRQPHYIQFTNPNSGLTQKILAVPTDRYLGNQDGQGGFGALSYNTVMSQLEPQNTDPNHPILIVLHHDGDNYGGGSPSYYQNNFQAFVNWLQANPTRFVCTTVQDYLQMFPTDTTDIIHIESGSWSGADNGDPEFKKWNADPNACQSPDRNSWAVVTAAKNYLETAKHAAPNDPAVVAAENSLLNGEASDYWYWDGSSNGIWDALPTRAANTTIQYLQNIVATNPDQTPPTIWQPQREPYNPGEKEWNIVKSSDFTVWSFVHDISGLQQINLKYRTDLNGQNPLNSTENETYAGGSQVTNWISLPMTAAYIAPSTTNQLNPTKKAREYSAKIQGLGNVLVDYYIEAVDSNGNTAKSQIEHTWVGAQNTLAHTWQNCDTSVVQNPGGGVGLGVSWLPQFPMAQDSITIVVNGINQAAMLHWGVNTWQLPNAVYRPLGSTLWNGSGPAVETPFGSLQNGKITLKLPPFNQVQQSVTKVDFVVHYADNTWDNNNGQDYHIAIAPNVASQTTAQAYVSMYPNPTNGSFFVVVPAQPTEVAMIKIMDMLGKTVLQQEITNATSLVRTNDLKAGIYTAEVRLGERFYRQKMVVNK